MGLGVSAVGSFKIPWGTEADSLVRVGSETVNDEEFYSRFFHLVGKNLKTMPVIPLP